MHAIDHVVVTVPALAPAVSVFEAAGFTVMPGGRHDAVPTENALVCFVDGGYLELLAARDATAREEWRVLAASPAWERHLHGVSAIARRFLPSLAGDDGVSDWSFRGSALGAQAARLRRMGSVATGPVPMSRERSDGERLAWELLLPESRLLPFWIADRTPRERRVPATPGATSHANGARGIAMVRLRAASVPTAALALGDVFDVVPAAAADGSTRLTMGEWRIEVIPGEPEGACVVALAGCATLPDELRSLGVLPEAG